MDGSISLVCASETVGSWSDRAVSMRGSKVRSTSGNFSLTMDSSHATRLRKRDTTSSRSSATVRNRRLSPSVHSAPAFLQFVQDGSRASHWSGQLRSPPMKDLRVSYGAGNARMRAEDAGSVLSHAQPCGMVARRDEGGQGLRETSENM